MPFVFLLLATLCSTTVQPSQVKPAPQPESHNSDLKRFVQWNEKREPYRCAFFNGKLPCGLYRTGLNFQALPGAAHVATARGLSPGELWFQFSSHSETTQARITSTNLQLGIGIFSWLTLSGRISGASYKFEDPSDLSFNVHAKLPWLSPKIAEIAAGIQDVAGEVHYYKGAYVVASRQLARFYITLGWGFSKSILGRGDGFLAALEWQPLSWVRPSIEWDGHRANAALRLDSPPKWFGGWFHLGGQLLVDGLNQKDPKLFFSTYLHIPLQSSPAATRADLSQTNFALGKSIQVSPPAQTKIASQPSSAPETSVEPRVETQAIPTIDASTDALRKQLTDLGFERVLIRQRAELTEICVDNSIFRRHTVDAVGVVLGIASHSPTVHGRIRLTVTRNAYPLVSVETRQADYRAFLNGGDATEKLIEPFFGPVSHCREMRRRDDKEYEHLPYLRPRFELAPTLRTAVATELGIFQGQFGGQFGGEIPLWWGASLRANYIQEIAHTEYMKKVGPLQFFRQDSGLYELALHQAVLLPASLVGLISVGRLALDEWNTALHLRWQLGRHQVGAYASFSTEKFDAFKPAWLGSYRIEFPKISSWVTLRGGEFPVGGLGFRADASVAFGDTIFSVIYRNADAQSIGVGITLPLTLRRDRMIGRSTVRAQVRGNPHWAYELHTRVGERANVLLNREWLGINHGMDSLDNLYLDGARLTEISLRSQLQRMRDAYYRYTPRVSEKALSD